MYYIHAMEYYSAIKKKEILQYVIMWMNLEDIMLSETSQTKKVKYCMIPLYEIFKIVKFIDSESGMVVVRGWGQREMESNQ